MHTTSLSRDCVLSLSLSVNFSNAPSDTRSRVDVCLFRTTPTLHSFYLLQLTRHIVASADLLPGAAAFPARKYPSVKSLFLTPYACAVFPVPHPLRSHSDAFSSARRLSVREYLSELLLLFRIRSFVLLLCSGTATVQGAIFSVLILLVFRESRFLTSGPRRSEWRDIQCVVPSRSSIIQSDARDRIGM